MKWSAVITTYNSGPVIEGAIDSILSLDPGEAPCDIIVVDNHSQDDTGKVLSSYGKRITVLLNPSNYGLSRANNQGAALARGDSIFFLNPDVEVLPGAVTCLFQFQEDHPDAAILGPAMLNASGELQPTARTWPSPRVIAARRTAFGGSSRGKRISFDHLTRFASDSEPVMPHWLVGAAMWLTPAGRERVGLMSEKYFLYFEDVEWCWRAWERGMEVWYVPEARIRHVCKRESASGGKTLGYHMKSMIRFLLTHPAVIAGRGPGGRV